MEVKDIKRLLDALAASDVREFSYETGDYKLTLRRGQEPAASAAAAGSSAAGSALDSGASQSAPAEPPQRPQEPEAAPRRDERFVEVTAPIVGTFYSAPSPDAPQYVKVGDRVKAGAVLCIIEAMKLMNEIEAEAGGVVREVLVSNEEPVEYGQVLFRIEPD
ncbi:MAG: acetyl-CoA carboxylase biotin carboxyl carrier protein [Trueperaceae bacterium]